MRELEKYLEYFIYIYYLNKLYLEHFYKNQIGRAHV